MVDNTLPNTIANSPHIKAMDQVIIDELARIDISASMMYMVDTVSAVALPYLADQFGVSGNAGYKQATTDLAKRAVIKNAIRLKRYIGTVWAVKQAMIAVGYGGAQLVEHAGTVGDGNDWARFRIVVNLGVAALNADTPAELTRLINEYKNVRSELLDISYICDVIEALPLPTEVIDVSYANQFYDELFTGSFRYDGQKKYDGSQKYKPGIEDLQITII